MAELSLERSERCVRQLEYRHGTVGTRRGCGLFEFRCACCGVAWAHELRRCAEARAIEAEKDRVMTVLAGALEARALKLVRA